MRPQRIAFSLLIALVICAAQGADVLTNEMVIKLVAAGVPKTAIIRMVETADPAAFRVLPADLSALAGSGVPGDVIDAMAARSRTSEVKAAPKAVAPTAIPGNVLASQPVPQTPARPQVRLATGTAIIPIELNEFGGTHPDLAEQDAAYGLVIHNRVASSNTILSEGEVPSILRAVERDLATSPTARLAGPQTLHYIHGAPQAYATAGGRLYVTDALVSVVGGNRGILAFVLGHEVAHNVLRHGVQKYLRAQIRDRQIAYYRSLAARGDTSANWALLAYVAADRIAEAKIDRDQENAADKLGLLMAAEAGYHPDFAIAAARVLREKVGEQSKFGAFFSDHPRWTTREQRAEEIRGETVAFFNARWPSALESPGGLPPTLFGAGEPSVAHSNKTYTITADFSARNLRGSSASVALVEYIEGSAPVTIATRSLSQDESGALTFALPDSFFNGQKGHGFVQLVISAADSEGYTGPSKRIR
jgi:hypothetical protein